MKEGLKKVIFYVTFSALGVFWAEAISTNIPHALINPGLYLAYGLLYVFFIDGLMRWNEKSFAAWYLFGALVGFITETYVAKVTFYSPEPNAYRILGVAPVTIMCIILFYHAFFSFLAPAYMAKRVLNMPLPATAKRWIDFFIVLAPLCLVPAVSQQLIDRGWTVPHLMRLMGISAVVLFLWVLLLRSLGEIKNVLLSKKQRLWLLVFTVIIYTVFLFKMSNKGHGHAPLDFPLVPMLAVSATIFMILVLLFKVLAKDKKPREQLSYSTTSMNLPIFFVWLVWHLSVTSILLLCSKILSPMFKLGVGLLAVTGALIGVFTFLWSVFCLIKSLILAKRR